VRGGADCLREPADHRGSSLELGLDELITGGLVQPGLERVASSDGEFPQPQPIDARMVGRIAPRSTLQRGLSQRQLPGLRAGQCSFEAGCLAIVVDRCTEPLQLVRLWSMQTGRHEQPIERKLEVEAAGSAVADRDTQLLLDRRPGTKAKVVVRAEEVGPSEMAEALGELARGAEQHLVIAGPVGLEPGTVVVCLQLA